ncbi:MAG: hypothetical protein JXA41_15120 [Deltaproteobacteria bacterium]|nr:hypothetical protein [Deltaproteobacteria bacterium]
MKISKSMKTRLSIVICIVVLCGWVLVIGLSHAAKIGDPDEIWGKPVEIVKMPSGSEERYYTLESCSNRYYRVFEVSDDGQMIDKGLSPAMP